METFRRKNGRFIKKSVHTRNIITHPPAKSAAINLGTEHAYAARPVITSASEKQPEVNDIARHETCIAEGECLLLDFGLDISPTYSGKAWEEGRAVVDLHVLFMSLICKQCQLPLDPRQCKGFHPDGICGYVYIACSNPACNVVSRIPLGKTHRQAVMGPPIFDVNSKLPLGKLV